MLKNCYLLVVEDHYFKNMFIEEIKKKHLRDSNDMMNSLMLEEKEVTFDAIYNACDTYPFMEDFKVLHVKNSGLFKSGKADDTKKLSEWISDIPEYMVIIFDEDKSLIDGRNALFKKLSKECVYKEYLRTKDATKDRNIINLLNQKAKEQGVKIDKQTMTYFLECVEPDTHYILNEFDKLVCYNSHITKENIDLLTTISLRKTIFNMFSLIAKKDAANAILIFRNLIEDGQNEIGILSSINTQFKSILKVKYLMSDAKKKGLTNGVSLSADLKKEICSKAGVSSFAVSQLVEQSTSFTFKQLQFLMKKCLESDEAIKTGKMQPILCLETLIITAARI